MTPSPLPAGHDASHQYSRLLRLRWVLLAAFVVIILLSLVADFMLGPSGLGWTELVRTIFSPAQAEPTTAVIVWDVRLPYAIMAVVVGLGLGLAGAEMQTILANPLASPFTLGISSAAACKPQPLMPKKPKMMFPSGDTLKYGSDKFMSGGIILSPSFSASAMYSGSLSVEFISFVRFAAINSAGKWAFR